MEALDDKSREWALESRRAQGLPDKVEDQDAIEQVAMIFRAARRAQESG